MHCNEINDSYNKNSHYKIERSNKIKCALFIIGTIGSLGVAVVGLCGYLKLGLLRNLRVSTSISLMVCGTGGATTCLIIAILCRTQTSKISPPFQSSQVDIPKQEQEEIENEDQEPILNLPPLVEEVKNEAPVVIENKFGKKEWASHYGDVGDEPPLTKEMAEALKSDKELMLVLIPKTVNDKPLTFNLLEELLIRPKKGDKISLLSYQSEFKENQGNIAVKASQWIIFKKNPLENSGNKTFEEQQKMIPKDYRIPTVIEAIVGMISHLNGSGERLFKNDKNYIRCQTGNNPPIWVGNFTSNGIQFYHSKLDKNHVLKIGIVRSF